VTGQAQLQRLCLALLALALAVVSPSRPVARLCSGDDEAVLRVERGREAGQREPVVGAERERREPPENAPDATTP